MPSPLQSPDEPSPDDLVAATAERQHGAVARRQLADVGLSNTQIRQRSRSRRLLPTAARSVYRLPGAPTDWMHDLWVSVLAGPRDILVSHTSAAALHGLTDPPETPHVIVSRTTSGRFGGAVAHHSRISPADRCRTRGLPTTKVPRSVVDCAALLDQDRLNALTDAAIGRGLATMESIRRAWERAGPIAGGNRLEEALAPYAPGAPPKGVKAAHLLRLFHKWGLPPPVCEYAVRDETGRFVGAVDFMWVPWLFGLEYDGDEFHAPRRWTADDRREEAIQRLGFRLERADRFDLRPSSTRLRNLLTKVLGEPPVDPAGPV